MLKEVRQWFLGVSSKMLKEGRHWFLVASSVVFLAIIFNISYFSRSRGSATSLTGNSIQGDIYEIYTQMPIGSKLFLLVQWILVMAIVAYAVLKGVSVRSKKDDSIGIDLNKMRENSKTDLDTLYNILKEKKRIRISTIAKLFNVKKEIAMEWSDILESGGLAKVDFPALGEPSLEIME